MRYWPHARRAKSALLGPLHCAGRPVFADRLLCSGPALPDYRAHEFRRCAHLPPTANRLFIPDPGTLGLLGWNQRRSCSLAIPRLPSSSARGSPGKHGVARSGEDWAGAAPGRPPCCPAQVRDVTVIAHSAAGMVALQRCRPGRPPAYSSDRCGDHCASSPSGPRWPAWASSRSARPRKHTVADGAGRALCPLATPAPGRVHRCSFRTDSGRIRVMRPSVSTTSPIPRPCRPARTSDPPPTDLEFTTRWAGCVSSFGRGPERVPSPPSRFLWRSVGRRLPAHGPDVGLTAPVAPGVSPSTTTPPFPDPKRPELAKHGDTVGDDGFVNVRYLRGSGRKCQRVTFFSGTVAGWAAAI